MSAHLPGNFGIMRLPRSVVFGSGRRDSLGSVAHDLGRRAFVCTDARLSTDADFQTMMLDLRANGVAVEVYDATQVDLPTPSIAASIRAAETFAPDLVIGIGGGSCMDLAKVVALSLTHGAKLDDFYGEFKVPGPILPVIAIPTTAGTGSEVSPIAVISDVERGTKVGISSPHLIPLVAICDPELTLSCPSHLTATSGADAMTHAIEAFTSLTRPDDPMSGQKGVSVGKNLLSDHFAKLAVSSLWSGLRQACTHGDDVQARERVMLGALVAGCAFGTAGVAAAHALQYPVGAMTHTPHGDGVACLMPYVMQYNLPAREAEFAELADLVGVGLGDRHMRAQAFIDAVADLFASIGIPQTLQDMGLSPDAVGEVARLSLSSARLVNNNPRPLDLAAMQRIASAAFSGDRDALNA